MVKNFEHLCVTLGSCLFIRIGFMLIEQQAISTINDAVERTQLLIAIMAFEFLCHYAMIQISLSSLWNLQTAFSTFEKCNSQESDSDTTAESDSCSEDSDAESSTSEDFLISDYSDIANSIDPKRTDLLRRILLLTKSIDYDDYDTHANEGGTDETADDKNQEGNKQQLSEETYALLMDLITLLDQDLTKAVRRTQTQKTEIKFRIPKVDSGNLLTYIALSPTSPLLDMSADKRKYCLDQITVTFEDENYQDTSVLSRFIKDNCIHPLPKTLTPDTDVYLTASAPDLLSSVLWVHIQYDEATSRIRPLFPCAKQ